MQNINNKNTIYNSCIGDLEWVMIKYFLQQIKTTHNRDDFIISVFAPM